MSYIHLLYDCRVGSSIKGFVCSDVGYVYIFYTDTRSDEINSARDERSFFAVHYNRSFY